MLTSADDQNSSTLTVQQQRQKNPQTWRFCRTINACRLTSVTGVRLSDCAATSRFLHLLLFFHFYYSMSLFMWLENACCRHNPWGIVVTTTCCSLLWLHLRRTFFPLTFRRPSVALLLHPFAHHLFLGNLLFEIDLISHFFRIFSSNFCRISDAHWSSNRHWAWLYLSFNWSVVIQGACVKYAHSKSCSQLFGGYVEKTRKILN